MAGGITPAGNMSLQLAHARLAAHALQHARKSGVKQIVWFTPQTAFFGRLNALAWRNFSHLVLNFVPPRPEFNQLRRVVSKARARLIAGHTTTLAILMPGDLELTANVIKTADRVTLVPPFVIVPEAAMDFAPTRSEEVAIAGYSSRNWERALDLASRLPNHRFVVLTSKKILGSRVLPANVRADLDLAREPYQQAIAGCKVVLLSLLDEAPAGLLSVEEALAFGTPVYWFSHPLLDEKYAATGGVEILSATDIAHAAKAFETELSDPARLARQRAKLLSRDSLNAPSSAAISKWLASTV